MKTVNENYPKNFEMSDEDLKRLAIQQMQANQVRQTNFPTEIISLPSKGLAYPESHSLSSGQIEMKYMTAREEDILTSPNLIKQGVVLDKLMQSMIISPINYNDLLIGDKNAIMIAARVLGYGKDYEVNVTCPECGHISKHVIDLTKLPEKEIQLTADVAMVEPNRFVTILPNSKREITFQLLTHGIDSLIEKKLEQQRKTYKKDTVDNELTTRLKHLILAIDGIADQTQINNFVDNELFASDSRFLRSKLKDIAPDINLQFSFECTNCDYTSDLSFQIGPDFFWPGA